MIINLGNQGQPSQQPQPRQISVPFLQQETGLGDLIARATKALGATPCTPCEERRRRLNQQVQLSPWNW